ncbi:MAG: Arylsulfatase [Verrucomicrobiota bacterium]
MNIHLAGILSLCLVAALPARADKPNILFILSDDQGYGDLGKHGHPLLKTPHLDGLYSDGVSFENFHVSPSCSPTRAALLTGMHEFRSGVTHTTSPREQPARDAVLLPELLKGAGYRTGFIGKWHLGNDSGYRPEDRGFEWTSTNAGGPREHFDPVIIRNGAREERQGFREDVLFDEAMDFIKESGDKPFFCYLASYSPHAPLAAPESAIAPFRGKVTDGQAAYLGMISNLDDNVGRILNFLKERDIEKNTIVIYMNDNGVTEGLDVYNASMRGCKCTVWEGGTRAMSLWRWPGKWPAHTVKNLTAHLDVLPTLCEVAGLKPPEALASKLEGFSLTPLLESDKPAEWHEERMLFSHVGRWPGGLAAAHKHAMCSVRQRHHLLLRSVPCDDPACNDNEGQCATLRRVKAGARKATYTEDNAQIHWGVTPPGKWALYDVSSDPGCTKDLFSGDASRVAKMEQAYDRWWDQVYPQMIANGGDREATSDAPRATRPATTQTISTEAPAKGGRDALFPNIDKNSDGRLTRDEFLGFYRDVFTRKDANADKFLAGGEHPSASLTAIDGDKDGKVSTTEWEGFFEKQFKRSDADADGAVTKAEWGGEVPNDAPPAKPAAPEPDAPAGGRSDMFPKMDADKDGAVSTEEFLKFYRDVFTRKDANADKFLTDGEHPASSLGAMDADKDGKVSPAEWDALFSRQLKRMDVDSNGKLTPAEMGGTEATPAPEKTKPQTTAPTNDVGKLASLTSDPAFRDAEGFISSEGIRAIYFDALPWQGKPTRVFAWLGIPKTDAAKVPGVVLVHGGGGTAFKEWVESWNKRGFAAISIAVEGQTSQSGGAKGKWARHEWAGPSRDGIYGDSGANLDDQWMYHAVADSILAKSLLSSQPGVDSTKVGIMGVSWGGVITSTVIGIDSRFAFAIPTYGCGGLTHAPNQYGRALNNNPVYQNTWDPLLRLEKANIPTLWFSWPQDQHFPLDCQAASYRRSPAPRMIALVPNMGHGHGPAWNRPESYAFAESIVKDGKPWCRQMEAGANGTAANAVFESSKPFDRAVLVSTTGSGATGSREWKEAPANLAHEGSLWHATAELPAGTTAWFINVHSGALIASSEYQVAEPSGTAAVKPN